MIATLVYLVIVVLIVGVICMLVARAPGLDPTVKWVIQAVVALLALLWAIRYLGVF